MKKLGLFYFLLLVAATLVGISALFNPIFLFKSGTAGIGIIILLLMLVTATKPKRDIWWIMIAFVFSIAGDWHLTFMNGNPVMFVKGIALYFIAHIGYLVFGMINGSINWKISIALLGIFVTYYLVMLYPAIDDKILVTAVLVYLLISCLSLGAAFGITQTPLVKWSYVFGVFLILFSDTIISIKDFLGFAEVEFLILPTYYLAHISITFSLITMYTSARINNSRI
jgi:hypothetical protein